MRWKFVTTGEKGLKTACLFPAWSAQRSEPTVQKTEVERRAGIDKSTFMDSVNDAARPFYTNLVDEVVKLGAFIYWGEKRFSVRFKKQNGKTVALLHMADHPQTSNTISTETVSLMIRRALRFETQVIKESGGKLIQTGEFGAKCVIDAMNRDIILNVAIDAFKRALDAFEREADATSAA